MAIPPNAKRLPQPLDPKDILDYVIDLTQGDESVKPTPLLKAGEGVQSFTLAATAEAVAAGLIIKSGSNPYPGPTISGLVLTAWLEIAEAKQGLALFDGSGLTLAMELTITTNSIPPRVKQRTVTIQVANQ